MELHIAIFFAAGENLDACATLTSGLLKIAHLDADGNERINEKYHRRGNEFFTVGNQSQLLYSPANFENFELLHNCNCSNLPTAVEKWS